MRTKFIIFLCVLGFSLNGISQEKVWLDNDLKKTSQANASFYKLVKPIKSKSIIYYKNGKIFRKFSQKNRKKKGNFEEYYITGELKRVGAFENDLEEGIWKTYYKSGKIKERGKYKKGEKVGIWKTFYKNI